MCGHSTPSFLVVVCWEVAVLAGWPLQEVCRWHGHWGQAVPTDTIVGFMPPQSPHLTENGAVYVCGMCFQAS